jgi:hypothetical protein
MDMMSMISSILSLQTGNLQTQIGTSLLKSSEDAEKSTVLTLLGQSAPSTANLGAGIGGNLDITA